MHSFFTKEVSGVSRFLATPESLRTHASAFPTGILASTPTGETKLLQLSKVADKLAGCPSRRIDFAISRDAPGESLLDSFLLKILPSERLIRFLSR